MRLNMPREFYLPKNVAFTYQSETMTGTDAVIYTYELAGKFYAIAFHGKAQKPDFHYSYRSEQSRAERLAMYIEARKQTAQLRAETKAKRLQPHTLKVGDILDCSWGWEQTNVDYYQVTRIVGSHTVEIRPIACRTEPGSEVSHGMADRVLPVKDHFTGEPMTKRVSYGNSISIESYAHASLWDGKSNYHSWYA